LLMGGFLLFRQAEALLVAHPHLWRAPQGSVPCSLDDAAGRRADALSGGGDYSPSSKRLLISSTNAARASSPCSPSVLR
jgi:hypothetical protein